MKRASTLLLAAIALAMSQANAQESKAMPVHLQPDLESPVVGDLESIELAVLAKWPEGLESKPGWQPVYFQGYFDVYVSNRNVGKDLSPKPGSPYLLEPKPGAQQLSLATPDDKSDLISVDARYCRIKVDTILLAYIQPPAAKEAAPSKPIAIAPPSDQPAQAVDQPLRAIQGSLHAASYMEKRRTQCSYKILDENGNLLVFLDTGQLPKFLIVEDYIGTDVTASGHIKPIEESDDLKLAAVNLKKN